MNELNQMNNNYCPDDAFTSEPVTIPEGAFDAADRPTSAFTPKYEDLTLAQKFAQHKEAVYKKNQVDTTPNAPTMADNLVEQANSRITVHADGSVSSKGGVLGNEKQSAAMIKILREQAYQRHNITD